MKATKVNGVFDSDPMKNPDAKRYEKLSFDEVLSRLLNIIPTLPESKSRRLLNDLEKWHQPTSDDKEQLHFVEKRKYNRKQTSIFTICETKTKSMREYTKNLSPGGVFIENATSLPVSEEVFMTLLDSSFDTPIRVKGKTVWVNPKGAGVEFNSPIDKISSL